MLTNTHTNSVSAAAYKKAFAYAKVLKSLDNTKHDQNPEKGEVLIDKWSNYNFDLTPEGRITSKARLTFDPSSDGHPVESMSVHENRDSLILTQRREESITYMENPHGGPNFRLTQVREDHTDSKYDSHTSTLHIDPKGNILEVDESNKLSSEYRQSLTYRGVTSRAVSKPEPTYDYEGPEYAPNATWRMSG